LASAVVVASLVLIGGDRAAAASLPGGLGPCLGPDCPATYPPGNSNGAIIGRDENVNVFAGGNYSVVANAAEAEGRVVVMGDFTEAKEGAGFYNVGAAGVGTQVPPPEGSTWLAVRGNTSVDSDDTLSAIKPAPNGAAGDIRGVSRSPTGTITGQEVAFDPSQAAETDPFVGLADELSAASQCYATAPPTGTVTRAGSIVTFRGDGSSQLQVFNVTQSILRLGTTPVGLEFTSIPPSATVLVNVTAPTSWTADVSFDQGGWETVARRLLWNIPDATTVSIGENVAWFGSTLVGNPASTATVITAGYNGRFYATGNIVHGSTSSSGGEEFHSYPFDGDLPECAPPATTTTTTISSTTSSTTGPTTTGPVTTAATTTTAAAGPATTSEVSSGTTSAGGIPATGGRPAPVGLLALSAVVAGGGLVVLGRRRTS